MYTDRVEDALAYMFRLHNAQQRKGSGVPYITHLLAVAALVGENGGNEDQFITALLHDAVEDQGGLETLDEIRRRYGDHVAELVYACSDSETQPKPPWRARKEAYLADIPKKSLEARLVCAADKLHNARSITRDLRFGGAKVWERFTGGREGTLWYYREIVCAFRLGWTHPILDELEHAVAEMHERAGELIESGQDACDCFSK